MSRSASLHKRSVHCVLDAMDTSMAIAILRPSWRTLSGAALQVSQVAGVAEYAYNGRHENDVAGTSIR